MIYEWNFRNILRLSSFRWSSMSLCLHTFRRSRSLDHIADPTQSICSSLIYTDSVYSYSLFSHLLPQACLFVSGVEGLHPNDDRFRSQYSRICLYHMLCPPSSTRNTFSCSCHEDRYISSILGLFVKTVWLSRAYDRRWGPWGFRGRSGLRTVSKVIALLVPGCLKALRSKCSRSRPLFELKATFLI